MKDPPHISLKELSDKCSIIIATKSVPSDRLIKLVNKMASLPSDEELAERKSAYLKQKRIYNRKNYARKKLNGN